MDDEEHMLGLTELSEKPLSENGKIQMTRNCSGINSWGAGHPVKIKVHLG